MEYVMDFVFYTVVIGVALTMVGRQVFHMVWSQALKLGFMSSGAGMFVGFIALPLARLVL